MLDDGGLLGPSIVHQHEYYRIVTSGFLHYSVLHIAFNMFFLYVMGTMLEPASSAACTLPLAQTAGRMRSGSRPIVTSQTSRPSGVFASELTRTRCG